LVQNYSDALLGLGLSAIGSAVGGPQRILTSSLEPRMPANRPEECDLLLFDVIGTGDLDAAVALYEPDATFVVAADRVVTGHAAIREVLRGMMSADASGEIDAVTVVQSADQAVAFTRARGRTTAPGPDGTPVTTEFHSLEVVRRQPDGTWLIAIDDPTASGLAPAPGS
jgi:uncharacterized protein (TIGR02246 family)